MDISCQDGGLSKSRTVNRKVLKVTLLFAAVELSCWLVSRGFENESFAFVAASLVLGAILSTLSAIDVTIRRLPDVLTLPLLLAGLALGMLGIGHDLISRVAGAAAGFCLLFTINAAYHFVKGRDGLGLGDAKLLAASGAWIGIWDLSTVLLVASFLALMATAAGRAGGHAIKLTTAIPFGPFLAFGTWAVWLTSPINFQ
jgi:leader peptidase (prepilin peptidase)/N-methyltransferase